LEFGADTPAPKQGYGSDVWPFVLSGIMRHYYFPMQKETWESGWINAFTNHAAMSMSMPMDWI